MREQLEALIQESEVTGLAVALTSAGTPTDCYTLGELAGEALTPETVWAVASLTKPIFVYGVLLLVERGLLDIDHPLEAYLPSPYHSDEEGYTSRMTARHAMSHTTGFPNWRGTDGLEVGFPPGAKFSYSSEGLTYLQTVVEHLSGMSLAHYLKEQVFNPLGMAHTHLGQEVRDNLPPMLQFLNGSLLANGALSLRTTVTDYARFMAAMLHSSAIASTMLQPQIAIPDVPNLFWGLGWGLQNIASKFSFWHWGARTTPKAMTFAMGIPSEQKAIVIFTNHTNGLSLCRQIVHLWAGKPTTPAFDWLLPAQEWRPDGKKQQAGA